MEKIDKSWQKYLNKEFNKPYFLKIQNFLEKQREKGKIIYPDIKNIFNSLNIIKFENVRVVIIGQDPYHGEGQAHGLSFSVQDEIKIPPSLRNIFKEVSSDIKNKIPKSGNLTLWAKSGVLLLNSILTVEKGKPASHSKIGWQNFTDEIIKIISKEKSGVVFLLWGAFAQNKKELIDSSKHYILETSHPSPFSAYKGFFGCKHFSKTNNILKKLGKKEINW